MKCKDIITILDYKDSRDVIKKHICKENKIFIKDIDYINDKNIKNKECTRYLNINGLYILIFKSRMKNAYSLKKILLDYNIGS